MKALEKNVMRFLVLLLIALMVMIPITWERTFATSSSVSISDGEPEVGDAFTVTVYYSGDSFGSVDGAITYDPAILRYDSSTENNVNGGNGELSFSHFQTPAADSMSITFYFTVIGSGSSTVTAHSTDIYNHDGNSLGGDTASTSFTAGGSTANNTPAENTENNENNENNENSGDRSNANLISLTIGCGELEPAFSPDITTYNVVAPAGATDSSVLFETETDIADYEVSGSREFTGDAMTRVITIIALDGTKKEYTINITRNVPEGGISYNGTFYTPSQNQNIADLPAGFLASKINYNGKELSVLKNRDGSVNVIRLVPEGGSESDGSWFVYNAEKKSFVPSEIINVDGSKYVIVRSGIDLVYGGPEATAGFQIYDENTNTLSTLDMTGLEPYVEPTETPENSEATEPAEGSEGTTPAEETKPAESTGKKRGLLWFILLLVLALIAALIYLFFRDKLGKKNKSTYAAFDDDDDDDDDAPRDNKFMTTLAGLKEGVSSKLANMKSNEGAADEESGMSERRIERRRRIAEAEARNAEALAAGATAAGIAAGASDEESYVADTVFTDETPISESSVVTKAELEAAKLAAAEKAREEALRAAEEAKAAQEAAAAAIAARDAARAAKARVASSELDSAMEELLEVGEEVHEAVNKKEE